MKLTQRSGGPGSEGEPSLRHLVTLGLRWSFFSTLVGRAGSFLTGVVLAHLLAPREFGAFAVAMVVFLGVGGLNGLGVTIAMVRWPGDVGRIAPTVTTLAIGTSGLLYVGMFLAAPWFASAMGVPAATGVVRVMAIGVLIDAVASTPVALLERTFRQDRKTAAEITNLTVGALVSIALAAHGLGAWSLAWGRVAGNGTSALVLIVLSPRRYALGFDSREARHLLAFGLPLAGANLLTFAVLNVDYMLVGSLLGPSALGYYLLAFNLSSWPVSAFSLPVRTVSVAGFSRLLGDPPAMRQGFGRSLAWLMAVTLPVSVLLSVFAAPLVHFIYGGKWGPAAAPLIFLALLGAFRVGLELAYDFLMAVGTSRTLLWLQGLWLVTLIPTLTAGAKLGGIRGVAAGHVAVALFVVTPAVLLALRRVGISPGVLTRNLARPIVGAALAAMTAATVQAVVPGDFRQLALGGILAGAVYMVVMLPMIRLLPMFRPRLAHS